MRRWNVIVELPAQRDIAEARLWLAEREPNAADRWFNSIYDTIGSLEVFPERCPLAPESQTLTTEIREIFHGRRHYKYRILFTVAGVKFTSCTSVTEQGWRSRNRRQRKNSL